MQQIKVYGRRKNIKLLLCSPHGAPSLSFHTSAYHFFYMIRSVRCTLLTLSRRCLSKTTAPEFSPVKWLDLSIIKRKGKAFEDDEALIPPNESEVFPAVSGYDLNGRETSSLSDMKVLLNWFVFHLLSMDLILINHTANLLLQNMQIGRMYLPWRYVSLSFLSYK